MGDRIQACGYFLERLLFTERRKHSKQRAVKGVEGWLALECPSKTVGNRSHLVHVLDSKIIHRAAASRASRRAAGRGDRGGPGRQGPARRRRRADTGARGRRRWQGLAGLSGVHSVLSTAVEEVTSPIPWPRALLELGEGRRGPGEGTAGVTEGARRRSKREAGVGGECAPAAADPRCSRALPCAPAAGCRLPAGPCS